MNINEAIQVVKQQYPNYHIFGCFLYGSQNYGLDNENSDKDYHAIIVPTVKTICESCRSFENAELSTKDGIIRVQDIRKFREDLYKGQVHALELLISKEKTFTRYCGVIPGFDMPWVKANELAYINSYNTVANLNGLATSYVKDATRKFGVADREYGYSPKALMHLYRIRNMVINYINEEPSLEKLFTPVGLQVCRELRDAPPSYDAAMNHLECWHNNVRDLTNNYMMNFKGNVDIELANKLDKWVELVMSTYFKDDLNGGF